MLKILSTEKSLFGNLNYPAPSTISWPLRRQPVLACTIRWWQAVRETMRGVRLDHSWLGKLEQ